MLLQFCHAPCMMTIKEILFYSILFRLSDNKACFVSFFCPYKNCSLSRKNKTETICQNTGATCLLLPLVLHLLVATFLELAESATGLCEVYKIKLNNC